MPRDLLRSQRLRLVNHQGDALRLGMNWTEEDLGKPQVLVDSADGQGHPGTFHFRSLIEEVSNGVFEAGGKPGIFTVSDICDGVIQATDGMSYSLISRDIMAAMVEIHALGHPHDGMVLISGNDKSVPAHLVAIARCGLPAIHLPGGTQLNAPDYVTSNKMWSMGAAVERGEIPREDLDFAQRGACPTCGACQFMGSASTGQVLMEALGLALPGSALTPVPLTKLLRYARATGKQILRLIEDDITPDRILTREAFENAIVLHAAVGGSTNALLHLPVAAREMGVEVTIDDFDRIHRQVPVLANVKTTGRYPVEYFWYAGGVPAVMLELRDMLHLDCLTVTGKTLGENLAEIENSRFFAERYGYLNNVKIAKEEIIRPRQEPFASASPKIRWRQSWPSAAATGPRRRRATARESCPCTPGLPAALPMVRPSPRNREAHARESAVLGGHYRLRLRRRRHRAGDHRRRGLRAGRRAMQDGRRRDRDRPGRRRGHRAIRTCGRQGDRRLHPLPGHRPLRHGC